MVFEKGKLTHLLVVVVVVVPQVRHCVPGGTLVVPYVPKVYGTYEIHGTFILVGHTYIVGHVNFWR